MATSQRGDWVIFADRSGLDAELSAALSQAGVQTKLVLPGDRFDRTWDGHYQLDPDRPGDVQQLWASLRTGRAQTPSVAHLWSLDAPGPSSPDALQSAERLAVTSAANLVRSAVTTGSPPPAMWFVTRGAIVTDETSLSSPVAVQQAPLWGLGRTVALEHPELWGGLVDVSPGDDARRDVASLVRELLEGDGEDQIALRGETRYVARLLPARNGHAAPIAVDGDGTYLVTGGLGALGLHAARWLVGQGARHVALVSRRSTTAAESSVAALRTCGANVTVLHADVSRAEDMDRVFAAIAAGRAPLRGVVHAAGIDSDVALSDMSARDIASVLAPKVTGGWLLHERTRDLKLDLFVCFSSVASIIGSQGHAHYGAANAFLDALALERRRLGLPGVAINWGPWAGGGMAPPEQLERFARIGNRPLEPDAALTALGEVLGRSTAGMTVADIDWTRFSAVYEARRRRPLLADVTRRAAAAAAEPPHSAPAPWVGRLLHVPAAERGTCLTSLLKAEVAETLGFEGAEDVPLDRTLSQMGMDSLMMAEFVGRLRMRVGVSCTALVFDHPQLRVLADHLLDHLGLADEEAVAHDAPAGGAPTSSSMAPPASTVTGVEGYSHRAEADVFEFQSSAWPNRRPDLIPARWQWMFVKSAERLRLNPRVWLHRDCGRIVGHMGAIPVRLKIGSETRSTAWLVDTMVLEPYRDQAIGPRLMVQAHDDLPFALSLGQTEEMRLIQVRLGWKQVAPLQTAQLLIRPERVLEGKLAPPAAWAAGLGLRALSSMRDLGRTRSRADIREIASFDERHDELWNTVAGGLTCAVVRDASYLNWKYVDQPGQVFVRLELLEKGSLKASAVLMIAEPDSTYTYRRAFLVDLVAPLSDERIARELLRGVSLTAMRCGADALLCLHVGEPLTRALRRCGFHQRRPTRFLLVDSAALPETTRELVLSGENWFVTHGDSDIDRPGQ